MNMLVAQLEQVESGANLFGWYVGFVIAIVVITAVVALVGAILQLARRIGLQAQMAVQGLSRAYDNTRPLEDLETTSRIAGSVITNLNKVRMSMEG